MRTPGTVQMRCNACIQGCRFGCNAQFAGQRKRPADLSNTEEQCTGKAIMRSAARNARCAGENFKIAVQPSDTGGWRFAGKKRLKNQADKLQSRLDCICGKMQMLGTCVENMAEGSDKNLRSAILQLFDKLN